MSALLRNLVTVLLALMRYGSVTPLATVLCKFWVSPFDVGISKLKSDRVAQLAEAAQFDYLMQTGLMGTLIKQRYAFVNAAQMVQFKKLSNYLAWSPCTRAWCLRTISGCTLSTPCTQAAQRARRCG